MKHKLYYAMRWTRARIADKKNMSGPFKNDRNHENNANLTMKFLDSVARMT